MLCPPLVALPAAGTLRVTQSVASKLKSPRWSKDAAAEQDALHGGAFDTAPTVSPPPSPGRGEG